jgi:ABC-type dipeptide/oligopeptide/nickel transport system ATPase component
MSDHRAATGSTEPALIQVDDLSLSYRADAPRALSGIGLEVRQGQILAIIGETGSGKSTLVRAALGLSAPGVSTTGSITVRPEPGVEVRPLELSRRRAAAFRRDWIGYVPQLTQRALVPVSTIGAHFRQFAPAGLGRGEVSKRAVASMTEIGLRDPEALLGMYPHQLSGGMAQRVCIALAMFGTARVIVADEPTSGLDALVRRRVAELLEREMSTGDRTMLLVTHDLALARRISTHVAVLYRGHLLESAPTARFFEAPQSPYSKHLLNSVPVPGKPLPAPFDPSVLGEVVNS